MEPLSLAFSFHQHAFDFWCPACQPRMNLDELLVFADALAALRVRHWVLQMCRIPGAAPVALAPHYLELLSAGLSTFTLRMRIDGVGPGAPGADFSLETPCRNGSNRTVHRRWGTHNPCHTGPHEVEFPLFSAEVFNDSFQHRIAAN